MNRIILTFFFLTLSFTFILAQEDLLIDQNQDTLEVTTETEIEQLDNNSDESTSKSSNNYFDLELIKGSQNPLTKDIRFKIIITPKISSPKTQIIWNTSSVFTLEKDHPEFVSLSKDQTYTYSVNLKPKKEGTYHISTNVVSWQFDSNKSASVGYNITLNKSLVVQPVDTFYIVFLILFILAVIAMAGLAVFLIKKSINILTKKVKIWLTPPI